MIRFLRTSAWDMLLCFAMIFALATSTYSGFYVSAAQSHAYGIILLADALLVVLMTLASYSRRTLLIGAGGLLVLLAGLVVLSAVSGNSVFSDSEDNAYLWFVLLLIIAVIVFAATRFRPGCALILPAGVMALCLVEFLYETHHTWLLLLYVASAMTMIIYRNYIFNVLHSRTLKVAQTSAVLYACILCLLVTAAGGGIYYGIVQHLHPPKKEVKIITKYLSLEVLERLGVADVEIIQDPDLTTDQLDQDQDTTQQDTEEKDENVNDAVSEGEEQQSEDGSSPETLDERDTGIFDAIRYDWGIPLWLVVMILVLLLAGAAVAAKLWLRRRWYRSVREKPPREQVAAFYAFYLRKLSQMKIRPVTGETPSGLAQRTAGQLAGFRTNGIGFETLTEILVCTEYGGYTPGQEDLEAFETFYGSFYRNLRDYLGKVPYIIKFFIL